jgi:uncharacterized protein (TIGR02145 family)
MNKATTMLALLCAVAFAQQKGTFTDQRDRKTYKTVKIGEQTWMAENLNYEAKGSKCYDKKPANCEKYGRLYDWATAMALPTKCNTIISTSDANCAIGTLHKGICPSGWHLPSEKEWKPLIDFAGGYKIAGKKLKAASGWKESGNGTDAFGFSALPGGLGDYSGYFGGIGNTGNWWSASETVSNAYLIYMVYNMDDVGSPVDPKSNFFNVRCIADGATAPKAAAGLTLIDDFEDGNGSAKTNEYWYAYTDAGDKGASTIGNAKQGSGYSVVMKDGADWVAKIQNYTLSKGGNPYEPYVALGLEAKNNGKTYDLSKCTNGFSYSYKGSAHNFRAESSTVSDYAFHQTQRAASANWATATVPLSQLVQPSWGAQKPFNAKNIKAFSWEIKGNVPAKTGSLAIDNFWCLGDMPLR